MEFVKLKPINRICPLNEADGRTMDDLISRAAAIAWFFRPYSNEESYSNLDVERALKAIPAVDAAPVVHAWWIETTIPSNTTGHGGVGQDKKKGRLCSNCKCAFDAVLLWCDSFCPWCGAKMDGERRESE